MGASHRVPPSPQCDAAAVELGLTKYGPSNTNVESEYLPSCGIEAMGLRWNKYGLLDKNMTTGDWMGFTAICSAAGLFECIEDGSCVPCAKGQKGCTDKGTCEAALPTCKPPKLPEATWIKPKAASHKFVGEPVVHHPSFTTAHAEANMAGNRPSADTPSSRVHASASCSSLFSGTVASLKPNDASCTVV